MTDPALFFNSDFTRYRILYLFSGGKRGEDEGEKERREERVLID